MSTRLELKVVPGASTSEIAGWLGDALKVRVRAPPERGKANRAVESLLADALNLPQRAVRIVSGEGRAHKIIEIEELSLAEVRARLSV